jgi:hypothetical protein
MRFLDKEEGETRMLRRAVEARQETHEKTTDSSISSYFAILDIRSDR